jgi:hypothetical protein
MTGDVTVRQYAKDDTEFVYGLQAVMAFEDGGDGSEPRVAGRRRAGVRLSTRRRSKVGRLL